MSEQPWGATAGGWGARLFLGTSLSAAVEPSRHVFELGKAMLSGRGLLASTGEAGALTAVSFKERTTNQSTIRASVPNNSASQPMINQSKQTSLWIFEKLDYYCITCSDFFLLFLNLLKRPLFSSSFCVLSLLGNTVHKHKHEKVVKSHESAGRGVLTVLINVDTCVTWNWRHGRGQLSCRAGNKWVTAELTIWTIYNGRLTFGVSCVNLPYCVIIQRAGQVQRGQRLDISHQNCGLYIKFTFLTDSWQVIGQGDPGTDPKDRLLCPLVVYHHPNGCLGNRKSAASTQKYLRHWCTLKTKRTLCRAVHVPQASGGLSVYFYPPLWVSIRSFPRPASRSRHWAWVWYSCCLWSPVLRCTSTGSGDTWRKAPPTDPSGVCWEATV